MKNNYKKILSDKKREAVQIMTPEQIKKVHAAIHTAAVASGAAGVIPIPVADAIPISAVQIAMVMALGKIFNQTIAESTAKGMLGAIVGTFVGRNLIKFIPVVGWGISAAVAAGVTETVGWTIAVDLSKKAEQESDNSHIGTGQYSEATQSSDEKYINELIEKAKQFLNAGKTHKSEIKEYGDLIHEIEKVLDHAPDELKELYDELLKR